MATDSTILPQGEAHLDSGTDMSGSELDLTSVQLAQVEGAQPVELPRGNQVVLVPVQPGQTIELPVDSASGLLAKIGPEGNLAIVVDGRTIILQGYLNANEQSPVKVVTNDGDSVDVAELVAATDPSLDIQTAAGPAAGGQGDTAQGSGIFIPFAAGAGLGGFGAEGVLGATALQYKLIDDERKEDVRDDTEPTSIDITFDILGGIINEDDLPADENDVPQLASFGLGGFSFGAGYGTDGKGNDEFDTKDREQGSQFNPPDDGGDQATNEDKNGNGVDGDREPLVSVATVKVAFGPDVPGTLTIDTSKLPTNLTSEGQPIVYQVEPAGGGFGNGILGFVNGGGDPDKFDHFLDRPVFTIRVAEETSNSEFHVYFNLYDNIDNAAPDHNKDGAADLLGAEEQILGLPVHMTAKDSDGSPLSTIMELGVKDDRPFFGKVVLHCEQIDIVQTDADITHDETPGVQPHSDDVHFNFGVALLGLQLAIKVDDAGFEFPFGESEGALLGAAKTHIFASFGADGPTEEHYKDADDKDARNSIFGELQDRTDADGDHIDNGENERPFELFMTRNGSGDTPVEDNLNTVADEGNLTIQDQQTNATVTWDGEVELPVFVRQLDAQTIVGYIKVPGGEGGFTEVAVFALNVSDQGKLSFYQIHQINHSIDGPTFPDHDDSAIADGEFSILGADGNPIIHIRATDFDGDHATQPVTLVIEDDGPKIKPCYDETGKCINLLKNGSFENLGDEDGGVLENGSWGVFSKIPGWRTGASEGNPGGLPGLEIQNKDAVGLTPKDGNHYVELDSDTLDPGDKAPSTTNATIYQDVDTIDGSNYVLKFSYSPRTGDENTDGIEVWFDGEKVATIDSGTVGEWTDYTFVVKAGEGDGTPDESRLKFKAVGSANELGGFIDNVSLSACALVDEDALKHGIEGGPGDDGVIGACFSGSLGVNFGADGAKSIVFSETNQPSLTSHGAPISYNWEGNPDGTGVLYAYVGSDPADSDSWVFKVEVGSLDNGGEYKLTLLKPVDHPDTNNDHTDDATDDGKSSFEDNLIFKLEFTATDNDGDTATGHLKVNVDDDSPTAECDFDCVTEGKTDGAPNFASGNVVTGDPATSFADDANSLDGNQDHPGADQPYTISKLQHCGNEYFLNVPEAGDPFVTRGAPFGEPGSQPLSGVESFDPATGILHIPTKEGGTLDIVMVSDDQSKVGDYKYTVPEHANHEHDTHVGPETLVESKSFGNGADWGTKFAAQGITLTAVNGVLASKTVDVNPKGSDLGEDYGGVGVASRNGDEPEVDRAGPNEKLRLEFANPTDNAKLLIGALFDGDQYDSGNQEILQWVIYKNGIPVGSGQILGDNDGLVTLDIDTGGVEFDRIDLTPVNNGAGGNSANNSDFLLINVETCCPFDKFTEKFDYTLRDADGDESTASLKIDVKDTEPTREDGQPCLTAFVVDEDGLPKGVGNTDSPLDNEEDHSAPNAPVDDAKHIGQIPFTPGADPTSIELTVLGGPNTGMRTLDGDRIFAAWDAATQTLIGYIEGTNPSDAANQVFKMTVTNPLDGSYTFELLQAVKHDNTDIIGIVDNTENFLNTPANFIVVAEIEDKDCDVLYSKVLVTIDDDMPVITECHDEQGNDINLLVNGSFEGLGTEDGGKLENGSWGVFSQIPGWKSGADEANPSALPGLEIQNASAVGLTAEDGNYYVELDSDKLDPGDPLPSTTNASIYQDVATTDGNNYVLSFSYSPRTGDESTDGIEVWFDDQLVGTIDSGTVGQWTEHTFVVQAGELDGSPDLSRLEFKAVGTANKLGGFIDNVSLTACALVDEDALPNGIEGGPGDDGVIGACFSGSLGVDFGADGGKSIEFFQTGQPNLKSHGQPVKYDWDGNSGGTGVLYGYVGNNPNDPNSWVFKVEVQSLDNGGEYKFTLLKPLDHPDTDNVPNNEDDHGKGSFEDNLIFELRFKATDKDNDTVTGHLKINVDDDSPDASLVKIEIEGEQGDGALVHDETKGDDGDDDVDGPLTAFNGLGLTAIGFATTIVNVDLTGGIAPDAAYGADGPGTTELSLTGAGGAPFSGAATNLFDTATGEPIFLYTEGNLVVGRIGSGDLPNAGGAISFALSIDNAGHMSVAQYRAIQHPDETNPDDSVTLLAAGEGGEALVHIAAKVTDSDGDAVTAYLPLDGAEGHGAIRFEDDGPSATCDYDHVTEGAGNVATGNVVTGANPENALLGTDANGTDGNADNPGVDGPYTISKLAHGGTTYYLNDLGGGVFSVTEGAPAPAGTPIDGVTETFDGKTLKIPTAEGGTLEIVMVSPTQSEVGEYRYTAGPAPIHAEDVHYGADSLAESITLAQSGVAAYEASFAPGITLEAIGGALAVKTVNVDPKAGPLGAEDYGGIGVASSPGDEPEVDQLNQGEALKLNFATPTDNAEIRIGALFDGVQYDSGNQEIVKWEALAADGVTVIASGQILGVNNGLAVLDIDTDEPFSSIKLTPLNNGAGNNANNSDFVILGVEVCNEEPVKEEFDYTLRDGDGDESGATLKICVEDTYPIVPQEGRLCLSVDEDGLPAGIGNSDSPLDAPATDNSAAGFIPFTPGADPVKIELSVGNGGDTGLKTLGGQTVLAAWDAASSTLIGYIAGTDPSNASNQVFKMTVTDHQTGAVTFDLLKPIKHADGGQDDNTENYPDPYITVDVQIEDQDCDVAFTTVKVKIDDDMPVVCVTADSDGGTTHDETPGRDNGPGDDDQSGNPPALFNVLGAGPAIGWAFDGDSVVNLAGSQFGADGPGLVAYALGIPAGSVFSGVETTDGKDIWLFEGPNGIVVGRVGSGLDGSTPDAAGAIIFAVAINGDGELILVQYDSLKHPDNPSNYDEVIPLADGALQAIVTITDADGDSVTGSANIGGQVRFGDDGPCAKIDDVHSRFVQHDETPGVQNPGSGADMDQAGPLPLNLMAPGTLIGWAKSNGSVVTTAGTSFGSDDEGATATLALKVDFNGVNSGLDVTSGQSIFLWQQGDVVYGRVGTGVNGNAPDPAGAVAFVVSLDADGTLNVAQYLAIEHGFAGSSESAHDDFESISNAALKVVLTVTDGDGDVDTDSVNIGDHVFFEDDGPSVTLSKKEGAEIRLDESVGPSTPADTNGNDNDEAGNVGGDIGYAKVAGADLFTKSVLFGQDGPAASGAEVFSLAISGFGTDTGLDDTQSGDEIRLFQVDGNTVEGRVNSSGGPVAFRIDIDPATGEVTISQFRAVEHNDPNDHDESTSPEIMDQGKLFLRLTAKDGDSDTDSDSIDLGKLIKFEDDGPIALNDVDALQSNVAGTQFFAEGNVISGAGTTSGNAGKDDGGTDLPTTISKLEGQTTDSNPSGGFVVSGLYGTLTMNSNGQYAYNFDEANWAGKVPSGATEVFTYTLKDGDGDTDPATLTITFGEATVETRAIVTGEGGTCLFEDTYAPLQLTAVPGAGDKVTQIVLTNVPAGWDVKDDSNADFSIVGGTIVGNPAFNGTTITFNIANAVAGVQVAVTVQVKGAPDSDVDGAGLQVQATVVDGVVFANDTTSFDIKVDAVADGDDKGDDGDADTLGVTITVTETVVDGNDSFQVGNTGNVKVTASYDDFKDGSETHTLTVQAPAGFSFDETNVGTLPAGVEIDLVASDSDTLVFKVDSKDSDGQNGVGDFELNIPVTYAGGQPDGTSGNFSATVTATEGNVVATNGDSNDECTDTNNTDSATATDDAVIATVPTTDVRIGAAGNADPICVPEDSNGVQIPVVGSTTAGSHLTSIVISGFPTGVAAVGWSFDFSGLDTGANVSVDTAQLTTLGQVTINFGPGDVTNYTGGTFTVSPPDDSDVDLGTLTAVVNAVSNADANVTDSDSDTAFVRVDAVADGKDDANGGDGDASVLSVAITAADSGDAGDKFSTGELGTLTLDATFDDFKDGSETHQITITAPAGFEFTGNFLSLLPAGVVKDASSTATTLILNVDSKDGDGVNGVGSISDLQIEIKNVSAPSGTAANFTATATAVETPSDQECDPNNNSQSVEAQAEVQTKDNLIPIAYDDKKCGDEAAPKNVNLLLVFDNSGSMNADSGVGGVSKLQAAKNAAIALLNELATTGGDVKVMLVTFSSDSTRQDTWLDLADAITAINNIPSTNSSTNYEEAIKDAIEGFNDPDNRGNLATHDGLVYFLSDGQPNTGGDGDNGLTATTATNWDNLLENPANNIEHVFAVGMGDDIPNDADNIYLKEVANPLNDSTNETPNTVILVDDFNDLTGTLTGTVGTLNEGNVLDGTIENDLDAPAPNTPDNVGDGFSHVSFFEYNHPTDNSLDITITWDGVGNVEPGDVTGGENTVINGTKVSFDTEHGRMTFDLSNGDYDFLAGAIDGGDKEEHFTYKINDSNGDQSNPADLTVCIKDVYVDKTPITYDDVTVGSEPAPKNVNLLLVFDNSGSMNADSGVGGVSKLQAAKNAAINMLNAYAATGGDVRVMLVTFSSDSSRQNTWLDLSAAITAINNIPSTNSSTNYEEAIKDAIDGFNDPDNRGDLATHDGLVYFLSDGQPNTGGDGDNGLTATTATNWDNLLENPANNIEHVFAVGMGDDIPNDADNIYLKEVANPLNDSTDETPNTVILVDDFNDLSATLTGTVGTPIEGNILNGDIEDDADGPNPGSGNDADNPGDGPAHLSYFEYDSADNDLDIKITWDGFGAVAIDGVADGKSAVVSGKEVSFDTDHGRMTIDFTDGDFKFVPESISGGNKTEVFDYKITDSDGDVSNESKLSVTIENLPGVVSIGDTTVNEGGTANIQVKLSEPAPAGGLSLNYTFTAGSATAGDDYTVFTSTVSFLAGATTATIQVNAKNDIFFDDNETYKVVISNPPAGWTIGDNTGVVTINDTTTLAVPLNSHDTPDGGWPDLDNESGEGFSDEAGDFETGEGNSNDSWDGEGGDDILNGAGGNDHIRGGDDDDIVSGGNGNDRVRGDDDDDTLSGGAGHDRLQGGDGFDTFDGGADNDWLEIDKDDFGTGQAIHGGSGIDVLDMGGIDNFTLTDNTTNVDGIEIINLEDGGADTLSLKASDVTDIADGNELFIWGDSNDNVNLTNGGWSTTATNVAGSDGSTYDVFQNGAIKVYIETAIDVNLS